MQIINNKTKLSSYFFIIQILIYIILNNINEW